MKRKAVLVAMTLLSTGRFILTGQEPVTPTVFTAQRPLAKGIADVQGRIDKNTHLEESLREAVNEHFISLGEIVYSVYGQEGDPGHTLLELKDAYRDIKSAIDNGATGQVQAAIGQFGQAILDYWSDVDPDIVRHVNAFQQLSWESARLNTTLSELSAYAEQISSDTNVLRGLEVKSSEIAARQDQGIGDNSSEVTSTSPMPVIPRPPSVDMSALDDAILLNRWLDLGNRAFLNQNEQDGFYRKFPALQRLKSVAETMSPRTEFERRTPVNGPAPHSSPINKQPPDRCAALRGSAFCMCANHYPPRGTMAYFVCSP